MPPYQVRGRLLKSGMTEKVHLWTDYLIEFGGRTLQVARGENRMGHRRLLQSFFIILALTLVWGVGLSFPKDRFHEFILDNGMKVILEENRTSPVVALQVWVKVGSGDEVDEEAGMSHFIEHMLFKGTEKRKGRQMAAA